MAGAEDVGGVLVELPATGERAFEDPVTEVWRAVGRGRQSARQTRTGGLACQIS